MTTAGSPPAGGFEAYTGDVYAWAYRVLGRHHDALDVVQDVFVKWAGQCRREPPAEPRGWLRRVTLNHAIDLRRRRHLAVEPLGRAREPAPAPKETIDEETLRDDIAVALDGLTEMQRSVLVAKVYDGLTFAQIAAELRVAASTAKTHYLRAVRAVRDRLAPRWA